VDENPPIQANRPPTSSIWNQNYPININHFHPRLVAHAWATPFLILTIVLSAVLQSHSLLMRRLNYAYPTVQSLLCLTIPI